jgi:hypothetical protein
VPRSHSHKSYFCGRWYLQCKGSEACILALVYSNSSLSFVTPSHLTQTSHGINIAAFKVGYRCARPTSGAAADRHLR